MSWPAAATGVAVGAALVPALLAAADALPRRRGREPAPLRGRRALVAVTTPLLLGGCGLRFGFHGRFAVAACACAVLVLLTLVDLEHRLVPNEVVLPAALAVLAADTALDPSPRWAIAAAGGAGFFLLAALAAPAGLGMGDVKLMLLLGALLGRAVVTATVVALAASVVVALVLLARHGRGATMPFVPFLAAGGVVALLAGELVLRH